MSTSFGDTVAQEARAVTILGDILTTLGGSVSFDATVSPQARVVSLLGSIYDALAESGLPGGVLPGGVTGITFLFRPGGEPTDDPTMDAYIIHGQHVSSFVRNGTHDYAPSVQGPIYEIQLDRAYEPDEVAVFVWAGAFKNFAGNVVDTANPTGAWSGTGDSGGLIHLPQVWQTGPAGDKSMRLVIPVTLSLDVGGGVTWGGGHSDPLTIMLVFFDRTAADYRNPALP